jgi:hypothetical protein
MKPTTKLYFKLFLLTGIPFGIFMAPLDLLFGERLSFIKFLLHVILFGTFMPILYVKNIKNNFRNNGKEKITNEDLIVFHSKEVKSGISKPELVNAIKTDPTLSRMKMSKTEDSLLLKTPWASKSFGEKIEIKFTGNDNNSKIIQITSKPKSPFTLVDYGKNKENVDRMEKFIVGLDESKPIDIVNEKL